jgi:hypothetical protein
MSYGVKVWGPSGEVWLDSTLVTWNLVGSFEIPAGASLSGSATDLLGREFIAVQIPLEVPFVQSYSYEKDVVITGNSLSVSGGNQTAAVVVLCR